MRRAPRSRARVFLLFGAVVAAVVVLALGCGGESEPDPFSGTWRSESAADEDGSLVIARDGEGYRMALVSGDTSSGWWRPLSRDGDTLSGSWSIASPDGDESTIWKVSLVLDGKRLLFSDGAVRDEFVRVSDSTQAPAAQ